MIKIDVISGFLGAGKTTLIKKLFQSKIKDEKVAIIENEFGEISIDQVFLKKTGFTIKEINAGCICCSLVGDFASSIKSLIDTYPLDRIIIEPSGVGKLSDILLAIHNVDIPELTLNIVATVVDGIKAKVYLRNFGEFFLNQIESANTIIVSKLDKIDNETVDDVVNMVKSHNQNANIISSSIQDLDPDKLLSSLEEKTSLEQKFLSEVIHEASEHHHEHHHECHHEEHDSHECHHEEHECCHHHEDEECCHHDHDHHDHHCHHDHHDHDADEIFVSVGRETSKAYSKDSLIKFLEALKDESLGIVVRAKGVLKNIDSPKWMYFDYVGGVYEIREGDVDIIGKLVVIGSKLDKDRINKLIDNL